MAMMKLENDKIGTGMFNIVKDYPWTLSPSTSRIGVPFIWLREFEQDASVMWNQLSRWLYALTTELSDTVNPYESLYHAVETKTNFILPYFDVYDHNINQNWETTKGLMDYTIPSKILNIYASIQKGRKIAPGTSVSQPRVWSGSGPATYTISFHLFNTTGNPDDITNNLIFKRRLQKSTLHDQRTIVLSSPPALFEVEIPGVRVSPAAVISQLVINNVGQMNLMNVDGRDQVIPDAWEFNITITELITESRQILDASNTGNLQPVRAITNIPPPPIDQNQQKTKAIGGRSTLTLPTL